MAKAANIPAIEETTKLSWAEWVKYLDAQGARQLEHRAIADLAYAKLQDQLDNAGWWSQSVTVAYEQHIGRRAPGQRSDGTYEVAVSKTLHMGLDEGMELWLKLFANRPDFDGVAITKPPTQTETNINRHWACGLADGTRVNIDIYGKAADKVGLTITQRKLDSPEAADKWRTYWKQQLTEL